MLRDTSPTAPGRLRPEAFIEHELLGELRVPGYADVLEAAGRIREHVQRTPLVRSARLDAIAGGTVWLKAENLQVTGSFKIRGAFNAMLCLPPEQREVLLLVAVEELSYREVATALGIPIGTVMSRLSRARARLRSELQGGQEPAGAAAAKLQRVK